MSNFFNAIGIADMEKVHSAMIAWILNDDANDSENPSTSKFKTFPIEKRSELLCKLFGESSIRTFKSITTHVEWNDIDIMIETKDGSGKKEIWVIENKLKSPEHMSNEKDSFEENKSVWQTTKYEDIINYEFKNDEKHYLFLSLLGEEAESPSELWKSFTYQQLHNQLIKISDLSNYPIVEEYANAINQMATKLNSFIDIDNNDIKNYPHVFNKLKNSEKVEAFRDMKITDDEKYIVENGLETIFQKCFLKEVIKKTKKIQHHSYYIRETHGTALWEYTYKPNVNGTNLSVQFQNGTFKVQVSKKILDKNTSSQIVEDFWNKWGDVFGKLSLGSIWKEKPNKSKKQKGPYFSFSMKKGQSGNKPWYSLPKDNIARHWDEMIQQCENALDIIEGYC